MNIILCIVGFALIILVFFDIFISVTGHTSILNNWLIKKYYLFYYRFFRFLKWRNPHFYTGLFVGITNTLIWVALLWSGWMLVFISYPGSIVDSGTDLPSGLVETIYFTGYSISTLGLGDFRPAPGVWRILTSLMSLSGLFLITLFITFFTLVIQGVFLKRKIALQIHYLGGTSTEIIKRAWKNENLSSLGTNLVLIANDFTELNKLFRAYPIIHSFHSRERKEELSLAPVQKGVDLGEECLFDLPGAEVADTVGKGRVL